MIIANQYLDARKVTTLDKSATMQEALTVFKESGYRCLPVLDDGMFFGLLYFVSIQGYELACHKENKEPEHQSSIEFLVSDKHGHIHVNAPFYKAMFSIKKLPFLAVVNDEHNLLGILTHSLVFNLIEDSLGMKVGGETLTIATSEQQGAIHKLTKIVKKHHLNIEGLMTLDDGSRLVRRMVITVSKTSQDNMRHLKQTIKNKGFRITHTETIK